MSLPRILLISGIPASGKSTYCRWLKANHGYDHCEVDWLPEDQSIESVVQNAQVRVQNTVIDWGFPPDLLCDVMWMQSQGVEIWWFDCDPEAARTSFVKRHENGEHAATIHDFNRQLAAIEANRSQIAEVFGSHVITSIQDGRQHVSPEQIFRAMFNSP